MMSGIVVKAFDDGTKHRPFGHCLVAGVDRAPLKVTRKMSKKKITKRTKVKPFVKYVNYNHVMPTRYQVPSELSPASIATDQQMDTPDGRKEARKFAKSLLQEKFAAPPPDKAGRPSKDVLYLRKKLRFCPDFNPIHWADGAGPARDIDVSVLLWEVLIVALALLAEVGSQCAPRKRKSGNEIPSLIPTIEELRLGLHGVRGALLEEKEKEEPWMSPQKDDLEDGIIQSIQSQQLELGFASPLTGRAKAGLVVSSGVPEQAEVAWNLLKKFLTIEEDRRFVRSMVVSLACLPEATAKFWKRKAALLLTLARLGADCSSLVAALLLDAELELGASWERQTLESAGRLGAEVAELLQERKAVGELVALFDDSAAADPEGGCEALDTWPASTQLCRQLFLQSCRDSRPVLLELASRALLMAELSAQHGARPLARTTLEFHAPIARALGYEYPDGASFLPLPHCDTLPATLEHFGLQLLYPSEYRMVVDWFDREFDLLEDILEHGIRVVNTALGNDRSFQSLASGYKVSSRVKSPQSLMKKLLEGRRVNDLLGMEVVIQPRHLAHGKGEMAALAAASGILRYVSSVENGWIVAPKSFKNYVLRPKKSGYQAIHLTLVTDFYVAFSSTRAPCQLELHIFTQQMKDQELRGPASHASYKSFPLRPEVLMEKLGDGGVVSMDDVAQQSFESPEEATHMLEELAHRAGYEDTDMDLEDLETSRAHVDEVVTAFQDLVASQRLKALPAPENAEGTKRHKRVSKHGLQGG
ncbi:unnamed protein product [Effrenium voratum]|nr:unnamed protein product [Effrenium voratum]